MSNSAANSTTAETLKSVLLTSELSTRPSRPPDYQSENLALLALARHIADSPSATLQKLVEIALEICRAGSAGVSLVSENSGDFYWPAIAGAWKPHIGGGTPRHFGPCGVVLDRNAVQLFARPERCYPYLASVTPTLEELLLTPFYVAGKAVGTVWVIAHDPNHKFDAEDLRLIESLSRFAAAAYRQHKLTEQVQNVAETLQGIFLPHALPHDQNIRFDACYSAAEKDTLIGGDWIEATQLPDGRYLITVGDVTGHGLNASIIAGRLRQAITDFAFINSDPASVLSNANRMLCFQHPDVYATAVVGFVDRDCTVLTYASAGHPPPLLATSHALPARELPLGGLLLGYRNELGSVSHSIDICPGSVLAFYTDGITEFARDINAAETALRAAVAEIVGDTSVAHPAVAVQKTVLGGAPPTDDIALLIVQFDAVDKATLRADPIVLTKT